MGEGRNSQVVLVSQYYGRRQHSQLRFRESAESPDAFAIASPERASQTATSSGGL